MESVGIFEAKTHFSALVERVESGETIVITKHGRPAAKIVPFESPDRKAEVQAAIDGLLEFRKHHKATTEEILSWIDEGQTI